MVGMPKTHQSPFSRMELKPYDAWHFPRVRISHGLIQLAITALLALFGITIAALAIQALIQPVNPAGLGALVPYYAFLAVFISTFFIALSLWKHGYKPYRDGQKFVRSLIGTEQRISPRKNAFPSFGDDTFIIDLPGRLSSSANPDTKYNVPYPKLLSLSLSDLVSEGKEKLERDTMGIPLKAWEAKGWNLNPKSKARPLERMALLSTNRPKRREGWIRLAERIVQAEIEDIMRKKDRQGFNSTFKEKRRLDIPVATVSNELDKLIRDSYGLPN
ncbi:hypothetical protein GF373_08440 [bacterium]|nr:hypothetical protein [bacterium]